MESVKRGVVVFAIVIFLANLASAGISISSPSEVYSLGDEFSVSVTVNSDEENVDFLTATLICDDNEMELYKVPVSLAEGEEKEIVISTTLDRSIVEDMRGDCSLRASYDGESENSADFKISGDVEVDFEMNALAYSPGESLIVSGSAKKLNGELLQGTVEFYIEGLNITSSEEIVDGNFSSSISLANKVPAGSYKMKVRAYEKNGRGEITNEGEASGSFKIRQVMSEIDIALEMQTLTPDKELKFRVVAHDQSGEEIDGEANVVISAPGGEKYKEVLAKTTESVSIQMNSNATAGYWNLRANANGFEAKKIFLIEEYPKISFQLDGQILNIRNIGNVPYHGFLEIVIGGSNEIKEISELPVGGVKQYKLVAPDGEYEIQVIDDSGKQVVGNALLTGRAVSVEDVGGAIIDNIFMLIFILIVLVIGAAAVYYYRKKRKNSFIGKASGSFAPQKFEAASATSEIAQVGMKSLIDKGTKQEVSVVALHLKNIQQLRAMDAGGINAIDSAIWKAKESGAKVYSEGDFRIFVLAPTLAKEMDNVMKGAIIASDLQRMIEIYNRRAAFKVEFGIGVNVGELIVENVGGRMKFMSVDNTLGAVKRLSSVSKGEILMTEKMRGRTAGRIKASKIAESGLWKVERVVDRSVHQDYIRKFKQNQR